MNAAAARAKTNLAGLNVLVVEDDDDARELFSMALSQGGARVRAVGSARAALTALVDPQADPPHVVVTDLSMPGESGEWLLYEIRRLSSQRRDVPVMAVTAHGREYSRERMLSAGFNQYATKPVDPFELCRAVATLAGRGG